MQTIYMVIIAIRQAMNKLKIQWKLCAQLWCIFK